MTDTTAKLRAKGLDSTGVTEPVAETMYAHKGRHYMAIVEVQVAERHEKADGGRRVDLIVENLEPAEHGSDLDKHLRELARTVYMNRAVEEGQQTLDDSLTPDLRDAIAAGAQHASHPFLPTDAAADNPTCEVCGQGESSAVHIRPPEEIAPQDDTDAPQDDDKPANEPDPHATVDDAPGPRLATVSNPFATSN